MEKGFHVAVRHKARHRCPFLTVNYFFLFPEHCLPLSRLSPITHWGQEEKSFGFSLRDTSGLSCKVVHVKMTVSFYRSLGALNDWKETLPSSLPIFMGWCLTSRYNKFTNNFFVQECATNSSLIAHVLWAIVDVFLIIFLRGQIKQDRFH